MKKEKTKSKMVLILEGIINGDGTVLAENGKKYNLPVRGIDEFGYPKVLIDAREVGGKGFMSKQSIEPYIGKKVMFCCYTENLEGFNYTILKDKK